MQINIRVVTLSSIPADLVTPKEFKFDFIRNREATRQYVTSEEISPDTLLTKLPAILTATDLGSAELNLASVNWLKEVVVVEIPACYTTAYGYIQDGKIRICTVVISGKSYYVAPAHTSYSEIFKTDEPYIGYRLDHNAVFSAVDAYPYLNEYNIIDPRFCMTTEHLITQSTNNTPAMYLTRLLQSISNFRTDVSRPWYQNCIAEPIEQSHVNIIDVLITDGVPNWARFGLDAQVNMTESEQIEAGVMRKCLSGLRSPLVTNDYDLWYHNIGELHALGECLTK